MYASLLKYSDEKQLSVVFSFTDILQKMIRV